MLSLAASVGELVGNWAGGVVVPAAGATGQINPILAEAGEVGAGGGELGGDIGWGEALQALELGDEAGRRVVGARAGGGVEAWPTGAGDPVLVAVTRPVVGDVLDGLVEVVCHRVHGAGATGAGHGDVGELAATALG